MAAGRTADAQSMVLRVIDHLKMQGITLLMTNLTGGGEDLEQTQIGISSIIDTWLLVRDTELGGERNRGLFILKSRGMKHSNQIRDFLITDKGVRLLDVYADTGSRQGGS